VNPTQSEIAAKCSYCGRQNPDCVVWCSGCGTSLIQERDAGNKQRSFSWKGALAVIAVLVKMGIKLVLLGHNSR
jgi:hypothetical protein